MAKYNSQAFTPEEVEQGLFQDLLNYLLSYNQKCKSNYYDIHITSDGYCTIVEWADVSYGDTYGPEGKFEFVDSDQVVMTEKIFPDNHTELCYDEEDYQERLKEFLEKNPGWVKNQWGGWTNEIDNEEARKILDEASQASIPVSFNGKLMDYAEKHPLGECPDMTLADELKAHQVKDEESLRKLESSDIQKVINAWAKEAGVKNEK